MKKFTVKKFLNDGKIVEYAVFEDKTKKEIHIDEKYGKYFYVGNSLNNSKTIFKESFIGRIADAVQTIKNGDGDCIQETTLFGRVIHVVYFIDREIGEKLRKQSLEGWKDTQFGWTIEFGNKNSFSGFSPINSKGNPLGYNDNHLTYQTFSTEEEARKKVESYLEEARKIATELIEKNKNKTKEERELNTNNLLDTFEANDELFSIVCEFVFDLVNQDCSDFKNSEKKLSDYGFRIIQCIIPKSEEIAENELKIKARELYMYFRIQKNLEIKEEIFLEVFEYFEKNKETSLKVSDLISKAMKKCKLMFLTSEDMSKIYYTWNS